MARYVDKIVQDDLNQAQTYYDIGDYASALNHFELAYNRLLELKRRTTNPEELKVIKDGIERVSLAINAIREKKERTELKENIIEDKTQQNGQEKNCKTKWFKTEGTKIKLDDVAGLDEVKKQIERNVFNPINYPQIYYKYNDKAGCNILMYGPPGCGKSFVSEAIVGEINCPYVYVTVTDILDKYVGEAPKKIKEIFEEAKQFDKCVIIFDEIDSLCASRDSRESEHTKKTLDQLLACMSGFGTSSDTGRIQVFIGATNRPWAIDSALLRGGRLDIKLYVTLPDEEARRFLINKNFKKNPELLEETDIDIEYIVEKTHNLAGADITSILQQCRNIIIEREIENVKKGIEEKVVLTKKIFEEVFNNYHPSLKEEDLVKFELYKNQ